MLRRVIVTCLQVNTTKLRDQAVGHAPEAHMHAGYQHRQPCIQEPGTLTFGLGKTDSLCPEDHQVHLPPQLSVAVLCDPFPPLLSTAPGLNNAYHLC
eukprot:651215-Pelagomonas_calceolata.AAC.3